MYLWLSVSGFLHHFVYLCLSHSLSHSFCPSDPFSAWLCLFSLSHSGSLLVPSSLFLSLSVPGLAALCLSAFPICLCPWAIADQGPCPEPVFSSQPDHTMTRWALLVLMVLTLGRTLLVPATPILGSRLLPQNFPQGTPCPVTSESPLASTTGPSTVWGHPGPGPRITLLLDVPLGLLQILLEQARARAVREQAAANAHILAHVGRR